MSSPPVALTLAGFDTSGGAGIPADLRGFAQRGCHGLAVVTSVVAETPTIVAAIEPLPAKFIAAQLQLLLDHYPVAAMKTGMIPDVETIHAIAPLLRAAARERGVALVVDPVMIASTGDPLVSPEAIAALSTELFPLATLLTPNLDEAAHLAGGRLHEFDQPEALAAHLREATGAKALLLKGGHFPGDTVFDLLATAHGVEVFQDPRILSPASHGTGCLLSALITADLAHGLPLRQAVAQARQSLRQALENPQIFHHPPQPPQAHLCPFPVAVASPTASAKLPST